MKALNITRVFILLLGIILFTTATSFAAKPATTPVKDIRQVIEESVKFPESNNLDIYTGIVEVIFSVNEDGKIEIKKIDSDNQLIIDSVKEQFSKLIVDNVNCPTYQLYKIQLTFKLI